MLLFVYGPAAQWTIKAEWFAYDQIVSRMEIEPLRQGTIVSINSENLSDDELLGRYEKVITSLKKHNVERIIATQHLPVQSQSKAPKWLQDIGQGIPVYLARSDVSSKFATQSGFIDTRPDDDGVLRQVVLWQWTDGGMTPSLPLAVAVDSKRRNPDLQLDYIYLSKYKPVTRFTDQQILAADFDSSQLAGKTILLDLLPVSPETATKLPSGQLVTSAGLTGSLLAALEQGPLINAPLWSRVVEWLAPLVLTIIAVLFMPGIKRRNILLITIAGGLATAITGIIDCCFFDFFHGLKSIETAVNEFKIRKVTDIFFQNIQ